MFKCVTSSHMYSFTLFSASEHMFLWNKRYTNVYNNNNYNNNNNMIKPSTNLKHFPFDALSVWHSIQSGEKHSAVVCVKLLNPKCFNIVTLE